MKAIFKRELRAYFQTMTGYIFLTMFLLLAGLLFTMYNLSGLVTSVKGILGLLTTWEAFILPILTMRMFAEDRRIKTDRLLMTAPVPISAVVLGKLFAAALMVAGALAVMFIYAASLAFFGTVNFAETVSSFIGFFLLCCVILSIGGFMSALTDSMVVAAFSTYAVLILTVFLGNIASRTGGNIQGVLLWLSPTARFDAFGIGIFDPAVPVYYISIAAFFTVLSVKAVGGGTKNGNRIVSAVSILILTAAFVLLNVFMTLLTQKVNIKLDLTGNRIYTLSNGTNEYLKQYKNDTDIYLLATEAEQDNDVRTVLDFYAAANPHIRVNNIDIEKDPSFGLDYVSDGQTLRSNDIVVVSGDKSRIIESTELKSTDTNGEAALDVESKVTTALKFVSSDAVYKAVFTSGHSEDGFIGAAEALEDENYEISTVNTVTSEIPDGTAVVIAALPSRDFSTAEIAKLDAYVRGGGALQIYVDSSVGELDNLNAYLSSNGIAVGKGGIAEGSSHTVGTAPNLLFMADFESNAVTDKIISRGQPVLYAPYARPLEIKPVYGVITLTPYMSSSDSAAITLDYKSVDFQGMSRIALMSENDDTNGRIYVCGTGMLLNNTVRDINSAGISNAAYFTAVTNAMTGAGEAFTVPVRSMAQNTMIMSADVRRVYAGVILILIPALILVIGLFVFLKRRNM